MNKDQQKQVKELCQAGGLVLIELAIRDIKADLNVPKLETSSDQLLYDLGIYNGHLEAYDLLIERLTENASV